MPCTLTSPPVPFSAVCKWRFSMSFFDATFFVIHVWTESKCSNTWPGTMSVTTWRPLQWGRPSCLFGSTTSKPITTYYFPLNHPLIYIFVKIKSIVWSTKDYLFAVHYNYCELMADGFSTCSSLHTKTLTYHWPSFKQEVHLRQAYHDLALWGRTW